MFKSLRIVITSIFLVVFVSGFSQTDSIYLYKGSLEVEDKLTITKLRVNHTRKLPSKIREYKNLEYLSLRPPIRSFAKPYGGGPCYIGYFESKIRKLPNWIGELSLLTELDLIGLKLKNLGTQLKKLELLKLEKLSIDPLKVDDELIAVLKKFHHLKVLKIRAEVTEEQLNELKVGLPDCEFSTGVYADY